MCVNTSVYSLSSSLSPLKNSYARLFLLFSPKNSPLPRPHIRLLLSLCHTHTPSTGACKSYIFKVEEHSFLPPIILWLSNQSQTCFPQIKTPPMTEKKKRWHDHHLRFGERGCHSETASATGPVHSIGINRITLSGWVC